MCDALEEYIAEERRREKALALLREGKKPPIIETPPPPRRMKYNWRVVVDALAFEQMLEAPILNPRKLYPEELNDIDVEWLLDRAYVLKLKQYLEDEERRIALMNEAIDWTGTNG